MRSKENASEPHWRRKVGGPGDLAAALSSEFASETREKVIVAVMNHENLILNARMVAYGSAIGCMFPIREILHAVLVADGVAFAIVHNHPSGNRFFSRQDIELTRKVKLAAKTVALRFLDHLVITAQGEWTSYVESHDPLTGWPGRDSSQISDCSGDAIPGGTQTPTVRIVVDGGIAHPICVPAGISVEIVDLDESELEDEDRAELIERGTTRQDGPYRHEHYLNLLKEAKNDKSK